VQSRRPEAESELTQTDAHCLTKVAVKLVGPEPFAVGGSFDQGLGLGFPVGVQRERATFEEFEPPLRFQRATDGLITATVGTGRGRAI
jgi:hypothetical protein